MRSLSGGAGAVATRSRAQAALTGADGCDRAIEQVLGVAGEEVGAERIALCRAEGDAVSPVAVWRRDGGVAWWGRPAAEVPEDHLGDLIGRAVDRLRRSSETLPAPLREALAGCASAVVLPVTVAGETRAAIAAGSDHELSASDLDVLAEVAVLLGLLLRERQLQEDARETAAEQRRFLSAVVHELRAPLTVISGYISAMESGEIAGGNREGFKVLRRKVAEIGGLVDSLLAAARIDAGAADPHQRRCDLRTIVATAVARARPRAQLEGALLSQSLGSGEVCVDADPSQVGTVLDNLINNAMNYVDGPARVRVRLDVTSDHAEVRVRDRGPGIAESDQQRVFQRFQRLGHVPHRAGAGLGLAIARELAERNGGSLELERSSPGRGSCFLLRLPLVAQP